MSKERTERKYVIDVFLRSDKCKRPEDIKQMMRDMFRGRVETLEEWARIDKNVNDRRVR